MNSSRTIWIVLVVALAMLVYVFAMPSGDKFANSSPIRPKQLELSELPIALDENSKADRVTVIPSSSSPPPDDAIVDGETNFAPRSPMIDKQDSASTVSDPLLLNVKDYCVSCLEAPDLATFDVLIHTVADKASVEQIGVKGNVFTGHISISSSSLTLSFRREVGLCTFNFKVPDDFADEITSERFKNFSFKIGAIDSSQERDFCAVTSVTFRPDVWDASNETAPGTRIGSSLMQFRSSTVVRPKFFRSREASETSTAQPVSLVQIEKLLSLVDSAIESEDFGTEAERRDPEQSFIVHDGVLIGPPYDVIATEYTLLVNGRVILDVTPRRLKGLDEMARRDDAFYMELGSFFAEKLEEGKEASLAREMTREHAERSSEIEWARIGMDIILYQFVDRDEPSMIRLNPPVPGAQPPRTPQSVVQEYELDLQRFLTQKNKLKVISRGGGKTATANSAGMLIRQVRSILTGTQDPEGKVQALRAISIVGDQAELILENSISWSN